jgi:hypothetical protein
MDFEASIEQVAGILLREDLKFQTAPDGAGYRLLFGSTAVFIAFTPWREGVAITVTAPILQEIDGSSPGAAVLLNRLNELNLNHRFLKFVYDDGALVAVYDLLGDRLQATELLNAVYVVAAAADHLDDELVDEIGGKRFEDVLEELEDVEGLEGIEEEEDSEP